MNTNCSKCLFADFADSVEPCKFGIINKIKDYHNIDIQNNFYNINNYICKYGFSLEKYREHKDALGGIQELENMVRDRAKINYYMVINLSNQSTNIANICDAINNMSIIPKYISILMYDRNDTKNIISILKNNIKVCEWKIHNFLENNDLNHMLSTVFDTHAFFKDTSYFWINDDNTYNTWNQDIKNINNIMIVQQLSSNGLFRSNNDGLFLSFDLYNKYREHINKDLFKALNTIENPNFIYYG